ncbi:MAG: cytochrome c [Deltaproteobacteria bacterium]|nr:cytochrome c [Deltaproteobacteria bacterium]
MSSRIIFLVLLVLLCQSVFAQTPGVSGDPEKGKEIFRGRGCPACHSIELSGGALGPDLTHVTMRRTDEWLVRWLNDPPSILKDTDMPKVPWKTQEEVLDLIALFKTFKKDIRKDFLGKVSKKEAGKRLIEEYDCKSCHRIEDPLSGRARYPDLTREGQKRSRKWLDKWLKDPQSVKPGTFMPAYPFSKKERAAIVEYLAALK